MHETSPATTAPTVISRTGVMYFPIALVSRLPYAMMVIGVLTLVVSARGTVELGGLNSAMVGLGVACFGPLIGAAADRFGQRPTLLITGAINSVLLGTLAWIAFSDLPVWVLFIASFLAGASAPQTSPMSRSRLVTIIKTDLPPQRRPRALSTFLAYESAADEVIFVFGPVIVGVLASTLNAWAPIVGAAVLTLVFVTAFALHHTSAPPQSAAERAATLAPASELLRPQLLITVVGIVAVGLFFGSMLTSLTAFMQDRGAAEQAGLIYGVMGIGSAIFAIAVAFLPPAFTLRYRWPLFAALILAGTGLLQGAHDLPSMLLSLAVMGVGVGPLLVTLYSFGAQRSPEGRSATVMTMLGSGLMVGQSAAAAITGTVADQIGTQAALLVPLGAALVALGSGAINWVLTGPGARRTAAAE
ncbi:MFS transporter [Leucobacter luti]|uniref:Putative MFS family arabinose efflux permease n=1 Tax=Leucobacter luti TaxID=340320 RepID=A0A4Q7U6B1_9MICO|nr:MFS transporter [Leucobacter luti]MBL3700548.1 MFS transporter [Leucobacter luti]RZT68617.1 putative MFS family arabinose efflux permease [Leucobacter luti]